jgi:hypothetical protein
MVVEPPRVLVVTGSMISAADRSLRALLSRQRAVFEASSGAWLDVQLKLQGLELLLLRERLLRSRRFRRAPYRAVVERYQATPSYLDLPELTEVVLITALAEAGIPFEVTTYAELHADPHREALARAPCVFASSTLLRDLSELVPLVDMLDRPHNRVVVGGALAGILHHDWPGLSGVDVLAVGYGEALVPALAQWIRSGFQELTPPPGGRLVEIGGTPVLYSGSPEGKSLDHLPTPDWSLAERAHGRRFPLVHYESVRGCPYRCAFCNYPYLFADTVFRRKSAARIAADWLAYAAAGARWISCLDSLFTLPPQRLRELCELLIEAGSPLKWACYARADDLADLELCRLMHEAGCRIVNVGFESGSQRLLDAMDKRCTVEANQAALANCRAVGLTSITTLFFGFPGETADTVRETFEALRASPPDLYYLGPFTTRVEGLPVMSPESRAQTGLVTLQGGRSSAPYWRHDTMSCTEVGRHMRWFNHAMMEERVALEGSLFYAGVLGYRASDRGPLLDFQRDLARGGHSIRAAARTAGAWVQRRLEGDVARLLPR